MFETTQAYRASECLFRIHIHRRAMYILYSTCPHPDVSDPSCAQREILDQLLQLRTLDEAAVSQSAAAASSSVGIKWGLQCNARRGRVGRCWYPVPRVSDP